MKIWISLEREISTPKPSTQRLLKIWPSSKLTARHCSRKTTRMLRTTSCWRWWGVWLTTGPTFASKSRKDLGSPTILERMLLGLPSSRVCWPIWRNRRDSWINQLRKFTHLVHCLKVAQIQNLTPLVLVLIVILVNDCINWIKLVARSSCADFDQIWPSRLTLNSASLGDENPRHFAQSHYTHDLPTYQCTELDELSNFADTIGYPISSFSGSK